MEPVSSVCRRQNISPTGGCSSAGAGRGRRLPRRAEGQAWGWPVWGSPLVPRPQRRGGARSASGERRLPPLQPPAERGRRAQVRQRVCAPRHRAAGGGGAAGRGAAPGALRDAPGCLVLCGTGWMTRGLLLPAAVAGEMVREAAEKVTEAQAICGNWWH